jgi:hypothetical protein
MSYVSRPALFDELPLPGAALEKGGVEMLRVGIADDELFVTARRAFPDPAGWGELLADIARRLATLYAAEIDDVEDAEVIESAVTAVIQAQFLASLSGADIGRTARPRPKPRTRSKAGAKAKPSGRLAPGKSRTKSKPSPKPSARRNSARVKS